MTSESVSYIEIPGNELEGGGQILRVSLCLSSLLNKPVHITQVRANRSKPGLQRQHLTGMTSVAALHTGYPHCIVGASMGSGEVLFDPSSQTYPQLPFKTIDVGTAGSIGLIIQAILPCLLYYPYRSVSPLNLFTSENVCQTEKREAEPKDDIVDDEVDDEGSAEKERKIMKIVSPPQSPPSLHPTSLALQHSLVIKGGTDVSFSPSTRYLETILVPLLAKMGAKVRVETVRHGFYPKGCGEAKLTVTPMGCSESLKAITLLERGDIESISIRAYISRVPKNIGDKIVRITLEKLKEELIPLPKRVDVQVFDVTSKSFGSGVWLEISAKTTAGCSLWSSSMGAFKKPSEDVAKEAVDKFVKDLNSMGCVDEYTQDQLLVFMALAEGKSQVRVGDISLHSKTAMSVIGKIAGVEFEVVNEGLSNVVSCVGLGYVSKP